MKESIVQTIKYFLPLFIVWKIGLLVVTFIGLSYLPLTDRAGNIITSKQNLNYWQQWANWDGIEYLDIAKEGHKGYHVAFFPLYPFLIMIISWTGFSNLVIGLTLSNLFAFISIVYLYKLAGLDYEANISRKVIFSLLVFPTSFFLGAVYAESLFMFLSISAFYYARGNKWVIAFLLAGLSASTRMIGLAVIVAICLEYYLVRKEQTHSILSPLFNRIVIHGYPLNTIRNGTQL